MTGDLRKSGSGTRKCIRVDIEFSRWRYLLALAGVSPAQIAAYAATSADVPRTDRIVENPG